MNIARSLRSLVSRPVLSVVAIFTLALGLGVVAAIFSLTREVLIRPLPYRSADRLVWVFERSPTTGVESAAVSPLNYLSWRDRVDAFEQTAAFRRVAMNVSTKTSAEQVEAFQVAPSFFDVSRRFFRRASCSGFHARRGPLTVAGVVGDVKEIGLRDAAGRPQLYRDEP